MWRFIDFIVQQNKRFLLFRVRQKDAARESVFFCIRYFSKTKSNPVKKKYRAMFLRLNEAYMPKFGYFWALSKIAKKSRGHSCTRPFISPSELYYLALCMHCRPMMREHNYFVQFSESQLDWKSTIFIRFAFRNHWAQKSCDTNSLLQNYSLSNKGQF